MSGGAVEVDAEEDARGVFDGDGGTSHGADMFIAVSGKDGFGAEFLSARAGGEGSGDGLRVVEGEVFFEMADASGGGVVPRTAVTLLATVGFVFFAFAAVPWVDDDNRASGDQRGDEEEKNGENFHLSSR